MCMSDWSSDVCSSDLSKSSSARSLSTFSTPSLVSASLSRVCEAASTKRFSKRLSLISAWRSDASPWVTLTKSYTTRRSRSEEHTSELQSLMRISYAVFCLKKKNTNQHARDTTYHKTINLP